MSERSLVAAIIGIVLVGGIRPGFAQVGNACDRGCLEGMVNLYLDAIVARDPTRLPLTPNARYTENGQTLVLGDGMWGPEIKLGSYKLYFADPAGGQVGFFGTLEEHGHPAILGLRLKVENRRISEMEALVIRTTARGTFNAIEGMQDRPILAAPLTAAQRRPRAELIRVANSYFEGLENGTDKDTPFHPDCQRIENGVITSNDLNAENPMWREICGKQFATGYTKVITAVVERRFPVVDEERGLVFTIIRFDHNGRNKTITWNDGTVHPVNTPFDEPFSFQIGELFKIVDGEIRQIEALVFPVPYGMPTGWVPPL